MRRVMCLFLCVVLILGMTSMAYAEEEQEAPVEVYVTTYSNLNGTETIAGMYQDNVFYVTADTIAALSGAYVMTDTDDTLEFALHNGLRIITVTSEDEVTEQQVKMQSTTDMPTLLYDDTLYVSAAHLLRYMGATVGFGEDEHSPIHMMVSMPYTVLDLFSDFSGYGGYLFSWAEAEGKLVNPGDIVALAALDTVLLGYDSNFLAYAIPGHADKVEKTIHADALLELLRNDGTELLEESDAVMELLGGVAGETQLTSTFIGEVMGWIEDPVFSKGLQTSMSIGMDAAGIFMDASADYLKSLETARQFANMTDTQKNLLDRTLNRVSQYDSLYDAQPLLFEAAEESAALIGDEYAANEKAQWDLVYNLMVNTANAVVSKFNPVSFAWDAMTGIAQLDPLISGIVNDEVNITFAKDCETVMNIGIRLLCDDAEQYNRNNAYMLDKEAGNQELLKADMILILKSVLAARLLLLDTGWLTEPSENTMNIKVQGTVKLLNKAQNAKPTPIGIKPECDEDITWIRFLAGQGDYGNVVTSYGKTYFWRYTADSFSETGYSGFPVEYTSNQLYCIDENGSQASILTLDACGKFAIANNQLFYRNNDGTIHSVFLDGSGDKSWEKGYLQCVTENGSHVIYTDYDGDLRAINIREGKTEFLAASATFVAYRNGLIYYSVSQEDRDAQAGKLSLYTITPEGKNETHLYTTEPDLYDYPETMGYAGVGQIRFSDEFVYFSYGSVAGSGIFYQGGRVIRVRYDGTDGEVVGGQSELVGSQFVVNADGSVTCTDEEYSEPLYSNRDPVLTEKGILYLYDPDSGSPVAYLQPEDYTILDGAKLGVYENGYAAYVHFAEVKDNKLYCLLHSAMENAETYMGWRNSYVRVKTAFIVKDLETGNVELKFYFE